MRRGLFTFCSTLLCTAVCALWVRSYTVADSISLDTVRRFGDHPFGAADENVAYSLSSDGGSVIAVRRRGTFGTPMPELQRLPKRVGERMWTWSSGQPDGGGRLHGFSRETVWFFHQGNLDAVDAWSVPHWSPALVFAMLPAIAIRRRIREARRDRIGRCRQCGYDLRATPDRCPECGREAGKAVA